MRRGIIFLLIFILLLLAPTGIRYLYYFGAGGTERAAPPAYEPANISQVPTPEASHFLDEPEVGDGTILLDMSHRNIFTLDEIAYLDGRLAARGFELRHHNSGDLAAALRSVNAYLVITPLDPFSSAERMAVAEFVDRGGRLLMVGDPTRFTVLVEEEEVFDIVFTLETDEIPLNSLSNEFDIIFNGDYLYNTIENEGNFRNIILNKSGFAASKLSDGLERIALYGSHSLQVGPGGEALLAADDNTWSSATDRPGGLSLAVSSMNGRVLAVGDVHFLMEPYYTVYDNGKLIANIADFLTAAQERQFVLADFPYFFGDSIDLVYTGTPELGPDAFDEIIALQDAFRQVGKALALSGTATSGHESLYLGLYNQAGEVGEILSSKGISLTIEPPIQTVLEQLAEEDSAKETAAGGEKKEEEPPVEDPDRLVKSDLGTVQMSGTALILLQQQQDRRTVVVLASSSGGLENTVNRLLALIPFDADNVLEDCLLQDDLALCPTDVADEEVEAELVSGGASANADEPVDEEANSPTDESDEPPVEETNDLDAVSQGSIGIGESVEGELGESESHLWTFAEGPVVIDIVLEAEDLDTVLEIYDTDNTLLTSSDSGFGGEGEQLLGIDIPDDGTYSIVVRDFFGNSGAYTLSVTAAENTGESGSGIFIFADDDGAPLSRGFTSVDSWVSLLGDEYTVTTWVSSDDGALENADLSGYSLIIWESGDYRDEEGFWGEDTAVILDYLNTGGDLLISGVSPTLLGATELAPMVDIEIAGDDPLLLEGFEVGDVIELDQTYDAIATNSLEIDSDENSVTFLIRGPQSSESGSAVGIATLDPGNGEQRTAIVLAPIAALPLEVQEILVANLIAWFGLSGG